MLMEIMGLHLPGASFVNPGTPLLWPDSPYNTAIRKINERFAGFGFGVQLLARSAVEAAGRGAF